jgi:hypothetical protein
MDRASAWLTPWIAGRKQAAKDDPISLVKFSGKAFEKTVDTFLSLS